MSVSCAFYSIECNPKGFVVVVMALAYGMLRLFRKTHLSLSLKKIFLGLIFYLLFEPLAFILCHSILYACCDSWSLLQDQSSRLSVDAILIATSSVLILLGIVVIMRGMKSNTNDAVN